MGPFEVDEKRRNKILEFLSPEAGQRVGTAPWDTADIPFEKQIPGNAKPGRELPSYVSDSGPQLNALEVTNKGVRITPLGDPRLKHLTNLSAGVAGAAMLGPYAADEEHKRKIREFLGQ